MKNIGTHGGHLRPMEQISYSGYRKNICIRRNYCWVTDIWLHNTGVWVRGWSLVAILLLIPGVPSFAVARTALKVEISKCQPCLCTKHTKIRLHLIVR